MAFLDTDDELARREGASIADLWRTRGESGFRDLEGRLAREVLAGSPRVVAFGGGTVTSREVRHLALDRAIVVTLHCKASTSSDRLAGSPVRPLLSGGHVEERIERLLGERGAAYAECHFAVSTDDATPDEVADRVAATVRRDRLVMPLGERTYGVDFAHGEDSLGTTLQRLAPSSVIVVSDTHVLQARREALEASLASVDTPRLLVALEPGEPHKTLSAVERVWRAALGARVDRRAVILAFGGGVVGDLAGFAAATLLRGLRFVLVPTSLLAMVDASVGGKTGFDAPEGKNLIGAFHQPSGVIVDIEHLRTLPARERIAGLAEVVKIALARDGELWDQLERDAERLKSGEQGALFPVIRRAVDLKIRLVRDDEYERGPRALLNLGHTVGHALEASGGYAQYVHGEAVALGLVAECRAAERRGVCAAGLAERVATLLHRLGLPTELPPAYLRSAVSFLDVDKKRAGRTLMVPLVYGVGDARVQAVGIEEFRSLLTDDVSG
jgi:shikimate kinase/3-dehydroquinate synthase